MSVAAAQTEPTENNQELQRLLRDSAASFARRGGVTRARHLRKTKPGIDPDIWSQLAGQGWLGILIQDVDRALAESFGMSKPIGALVARVLPDSPAQKAGVQVGDVIVEFDGKEVESSGALPPMVGVSKVGTKVPVKVIRSGKPLTLKVTISELPEEEELNLAAGDEQGGGTKIKRLAIAVSELEAEQKQELEGKGGVLVEGLESGPASKAGVRRGDIILRLNNVEVASVEQFKKLVADLPAGKAVPILVQRRGSPIFLALRLDEDAKH